MLLPNIWLWQMLLPLRLMLLPFVLFMVLADVIANFYCNVVADVIAKWQMLWPLQGGWWYCGWCYCHRADGIVIGQYFTLVLVLRCYQEPHPIYVADGICQHFCLGMDCWPLYIEPLLLPFWGCFPPFLLYWSDQHLYHDQWWYGGQIWGRGPFDVL